MGDIIEHPPLVLTGSSPFWMPGEGVLGMFTGKIQSGGARSYFGEWIFCLEIHANYQWSCVQN